MPWHEPGPLRRMFVTVLILIAAQAIGFGIGLNIVNDKADRAELKSRVSAEALRAQRADCESRVDARDVLRDVIIRSYTTTSPDPAIQAIVAERRADVLSRTPRLHCVTVAGEIVPRPLDVEGSK